MADRRKVFQRVGIRRDKNFGDLSDSVEGLNNLLDTLVDSSDATFISQDLDAIRGIASEGLESDEYRNFIGSAVQQTGVDGVNSAIFPRISYQNRLDKFEATAGLPRINGGDGLTAKYYNQDQVQNTTDVFTGITTGTSIPDDSFWEAGQFNYTGKFIHNQQMLLVVCSGKDSLSQHRLDRIILLHQHLWDSPWILRQKDIVELASEHIQNT